jgi:hypothetical protein
VENEMKATEIRSSKDNYRIRHAELETVIVHGIRTVYRE